MRIAALTLPLLLLVCGSCSMFSSDEEIDFAQPNSLMADEIENRVQQIPFQHRDELMMNLLWLAQTGETAIPALLRGLKHESPKVRSSSAWTLGRIHDRRTIPALQVASKDANETVRLEVARSLVMLGDLTLAPALIEGLDSEKKEVRYLCHEALKGATGRDFGFDHLSDNQVQRRLAVLGWRQWWGEYAGDTFFANSYRQRYQLDPTAQPMGETQAPVQDPWRTQDPQPTPTPQGQNQPTTPKTDDGVIVVPTPGDPQEPQPQNPTGGTPGTDPSMPEPMPDPVPVVPAPGTEPLPATEPTPSPTPQPVPTQPKPKTGVRPYGR